jgi:hypothetical protein
MGHCEISSGIVSFIRVPHRPLTGRGNAQFGAVGNDAACVPVALRATRSGLPIAGADCVPLEKHAASLRRLTRFLRFPRKKYVANFFALVGWIAVANHEAPENRERWQNRQVLIAT